MAITDLISLRAAIIAWSERYDLSNDRVDECVQQATAMFNTGSSEISPLRTREMMEVATLTPASGVCALPTDYQQYRRVVSSASYRRPIEYITPSLADELYPSSSSGVPIHFTIIGDSLYPYPSTSADIELSYYQSIPGLVADADTNWLLQKHPGVYLHGSLFFVGAFVRDADLQARSFGMLRSLVEGINNADMTSQYSAAQSYPRGITIA